MYRKPINIDLNRTVVSLSLYTLVIVTWWAGLHSFCVFGKSQFGIFARESLSEAFCDFLQCVEEARPQLSTYFALHHLRLFYRWQLHNSICAVEYFLNIWYSFSCSIHFSTFTTSTKAYIWPLVGTIWIHLTSKHPTHLGVILALQSPFG
jgi:hypothetical protein